MGEEEKELEKLKRTQKFYDQQLSIPALKYYLGTALFWMLTVGPLTFLFNKLYDGGPFNWSILPQHLMIHFAGGFIFGLLLRWWYVSLNNDNNEKIKEIER